MARVSSFANYEDIFDRSPDPALLMNLDDNIIVDASFSAERILGNGEADCLNGKALDVFIESSSEKHYNRQIDILKRKFYPRSFETKIMGQEGKIWDAEIIGHLIYLNDESAVLQVFIKDITERKLHEELQKLSLENAKMVVQHMLPGSIPKPSGYDIAVYYEACSAVGGDFYDFIHVDDAHLGLCLGDARGHGLEAALVMGMVRKALSICAVGELDPAKVLCKTNHNIAPDLNKGNFATCFYGLLNHEVNELQFCCAGHNHSMVISQKDDEVKFMEGTGLPLGFKLKQDIFEKKLSTMKHLFEVGDVFIQYSDGIVETENKKGEMYDFERFTEVVQAHKEQNASEISEAVIQSVKKFQRKQAQRDDISLLVVKRQA
jgi:PAS domain S-box-containing protein